MRVDPQSFESVYQQAPDPWAFSTSSYEVDRYETTVACLGADRYQRCFEPACSIGELTDRLADRSEHVVACDPSPSAANRARTRLAARHNVEVNTAAIPEWWPVGSFDLIVLSELGYYWDVVGWRDVIQRCRNSLEDGGELIAVHWLGFSSDHVLSGVRVHRELATHLGLPDLHLERTGHPDTNEAAGFVLDRWASVSGG
jgi:SAM-dependent methyltransferase